MSSVRSVSIYRLSKRRCTFKFNGTQEPGPSRWTGQSRSHEGHFSAAFAESLPSVKEVSAITPVIANGKSRIDKLYKGQKLELISTPRILKKRKYKWRTWNETKSD